MSYAYNWSRYSIEITLLAIIGKYGHPLANDICCTEHCSGINEQKSTKNYYSIRINDGTAESAIISSNGQPTKTETVPSNFIIKEIIIQHTDIQPVVNLFEINFPRCLPLVTAQVSRSIA